MDDLDRRLRARLERLAEAVPVEPAAVATEPVRRGPSARPERARLLASAAVAVVAVAVVAVASGLVAGFASTPASTAGADVPTMPTAASTLGVEGGRYPDGIPMSFGGEPVLRGAAALARARAATDATPFLVGGWLTVGSAMPISCHVVLSGSVSWFSSTCGEPRFSDVAGADDPRFIGMLTFATLDGGPVALPDGALIVPWDSLSTGPVIVRVRVHDPAASDCGGDASVCDKLMAAQEVVWAGDEATAPGPISLTAAADAARPYVHGTLTDAAAVFLDCGSALPSAQVMDVDGLMASIPSATAVEVEPTAAALRLALPLAGPDPFAGSNLACAVISSTDTASTGASFRWVVVANVAVMVRVSGSPTAADQALVASLTRDLEAAARRAAGGSAAPSGDGAPPASTTP